VSALKVTTDMPPADEGLTPRGRRTRDALVAAARDVFERDGFGARITDISEAAGVAHGTFYTYFDSKESIFLAVSRDLLEEFYPRRPRSEPGGRTAYQSIEAANRHYLESYLRHGRLMVIWEELAGISPDLSRLIDDARAAVVDRTRRSIQRLQARGEADPAIDARYAAHALGGMVNQFAYSWVARGEQFELETAVAQLTLLWAAALGVPVPDREENR
jgi:AcrR family transcriptional regulator